MTVSVISSGHVLHFLAISMNIVAYLVLYFVRHATVLIYIRCMYTYICSGVAMCVFAVSKFFYC